MAKSTKEVKEKAIEVTLWEAANKLRGSVVDNPVAIGFFVTFDEISYLVHNKKIEMTKNQD